MRKALLLLVWLPITFASCEPDIVAEDTPKDYRDAFVGSYYGWCQHITWQMGQSPQTIFDGPDTYTVTAVADSFISLNGSDSIPIGTDGTFERFMGATTYFSVQFIAPDSMLVTDRYGGQGGWSNRNFRGRR